MGFHSRFGGYKMIDEKELPNIGTPKEALEKMKEGFKAFLDSSAKFVTIAEFYTDKANEGQPLPSNFQERYTINYQKLKAETSENFGNQIAFFTLLYLDFIDDIKENLKEYEKLLNDGPDKEASEYDQACDYLAIRDEFTDLRETLDDVNAQIAAERIADTNYNDPEYDYNAKMVDENKFKE